MRLFRMLGMVLFWICALRALPTTIPIAFTLEKAGQVSLAIYDAGGMQLRELLRGARYDAGDYTVFWDGLDRDGRAAPEGAYHWKLLRTPGFQAEYLLTIGSSTISAPQHLWVGNHSGAASVHIDETGEMYVGASCAENVPVLLKQTLEGRQRRWEKFRPQIISDRWVGPVAMASGAGRLFFLTHGSEDWPSYQIWTLDAQTGERVKEHNGVFSATWPAAKAGEETTPANRPDDMTGRDAFCVISYPAQNALRWLEIPGGTELRRLTLPSPTGVAVAADNSVYVISDTQVVRIPPGEMDPTVIIPEGRLRSPHRLAIDRTTGELLITEGNPHANQVSRYTPDGTRIASYGRQGGRQFGAYVAEDFYRITDITDDGQGGFLVTEDGEQTLRRTAHFNRAGQVLREWFGGQRWGSNIAFDPQDPTVISLYGGSGIRTFAKADFARRHWQVTHVFPEPETGELMPPLAGHDALWQLTRRHGKLYLVNNGGNRAATAPAIYAVDLAGNRLLPLARAGVIRRDQPPPVWWVAAMAHAGNPWDATARFLPDAYLAYVWTDGNGDGEAQAAEFTLHSGVGIAGNHLSIDEEWNVIVSIRAVGTPATTAACYRLENETPEAELPTWNWQHLSRTPLQLPGELTAFRHAGAVALFQDSQRNLYALLKGESHPDDDRQGNVWPGVTSGMARFVKWDTGGALNWRLGKHGGTNDLLPGEFQDPMRILGEAHGCVITQDRVIRPAMVWTLDGLYAGFFLDSRVPDGLPDEIYSTASASHQQGLFLHDHIGGVMVQTLQGEVLWSPNGRDGSPIYRIHGWEGWERQQGFLTIQQPPVAAREEGRGLTGAYYANGAFAGEPSLTRTDAQIWFGPRWLPFTAAPRNPRPWFTQQMPLPVDLTLFSARWSGMLEPRFSESYRFFLENAGKNQARLWVNGQLVINAWRDEGAPLIYGDYRWRDTGGQQFASQPLALTAGIPVVITLEYAANGGDASLHLSWESWSQERQHIPASVLYPPE